MIFYLIEVKGLHVNLDNCIEKGTVAETSIISASASPRCWEKHHFRHSIGIFDFVADLHRSSLKKWRQCDRILEIMAEKVAASSKKHKSHTPTKLAWQRYGRKNRHKMQDDRKCSTEKRKMPVEWRFYRKASKSKQNFNKKKRRLKNGSHL